MDKRIVKVLVILLVFFVLGMSYFLSEFLGLEIIGHTEALSSLEDFIFVLFYILFTSVFHYVFFILPYCKNKYRDGSAKLMAKKIYLYKFFASIVLHVFITDYFLGIEFALIFILMVFPIKR